MTCTWTSGVTIRFGSFISFASEPARTVAATPLITERRRSRPPRSSSANWLTWVNAESAGEIWPLVLWMITRTYLLGCCLAPLTRPGEIHVFFGDAFEPSRACLPPGALAARGTLMTSNAASAVIAPRPPLPHSALERDSPPRLPVPHSALDRVSPRLPPFMLTLCVSFPRFLRGPHVCLPAAEADRPPLRNPGAT